jgi:hypothetical protein
VFPNIFIEPFIQEFNSFLDLENMGKSQFMHGCQYFTGINAVGKLAGENCRNECNPGFKIVYVIEIILLNNDGTYRTYTVALSAIDTPVGMQLRFAAHHADCLGRADIHTMRAPDADIFPEPQGMMELYIFSGLHGCYLWK